MTRAEYDIAVIGSGPGGYVAAVRAAQLGAKVALIERDSLGGICLNWGCIPTKALLHAAETWRGLRHAEGLGIRVAGASFDFGRVMARSREVSERLSKGVMGLMSKHRVKVLQGSGKLLGASRVAVTGPDGGQAVIGAREIIVATGARPRELPGVKCDGTRIWTSKDALAAKHLPKSMIIIGAGAIGMEFASFYASFGTAVTVLEAQERVLPLEDADISSHVAKAYEAQGVKVVTNVRLEELVAGPGGVSARLAHASEVQQAEVALLAIGVIGNIEDLGLENTQVQVEPGRIVADAFGATADPHVHAIGDVTGSPWLAHRAMHHGVACVERLLGLKPSHALRSEEVPGCTYGHPQTASIGLTEQAAKERKINYRVGRFPLAGNGKAVALADTNGFVKTLVDADTGEILGAHLVGPGVTELVGTFSVAKALEATDDSLFTAVWPHPTLSESLHESLLAAASRALHV